MYRLHRRFMNFNKLMGISHTDDEAAVGADLSRPPPIYRPRGNPQHIPVHFLNRQGKECEGAAQRSSKELR